MQKTFIPLLLSDVTLFLWFLYSFHAASLDFEAEVWITDCATRFDAVSLVKYTVIDHPTSVFFLIGA